MTDLLILNGAIRTQEGWIEGGYLYIDEEKIADFGQGEPPVNVRSSSTEVLNASNCAVLPGLTNAHTHLSQSFMRGLAGGRSLIDWLQQVIWPLQNTISPDEVYLASLLSLVENLRSGVTQVIDHHKITKTLAHTDAVLRAAREVGQRFTLARAWSDLGRSPEDPQLILDDLTRLFAITANDERITVANGPLALWRCSKKALQATHELALQHHSFSHIHVSESLQEVEMSLKAYGQTPVKWLDDIGVLDPATQLVHAVWLDDEERQRVKSRGSPVIHCPVSNSILGSGIAPIVRMLEQGIRIKLGTDGAASNDTQDIWETLKFAVCLARAVEGDATLLPGTEALSLVMDDQSLVVGNPADVIVINLNHPGVVPVADFDSALIFGNHTNEVEVVVLNGKVVMRDGKITILDEESLLKECNQAAETLRHRTGIRPASQR